MTFGEKMKSLRAEKGWSEARLAQESGVPFGTLHNYGIGIRKPTFGAVVRLARALGVSTDAFADCDDIAGPEEGAADGVKARRGRPDPGEPQREAEGGASASGAVESGAPPTAAKATQRRGRRKGGEPA